MLQQRRRDSARALSSRGRLTLQVALFGTVEELSQSERAQTLVREQFATNVFAPVNLIKTALPSMRANRGGQILLLSAVCASPKLFAYGRGRGAD